MNIILVLTLVVWLQKIDPSLASRLRENSNVLVPSNDASLHEKIKTLLNGDEEIDPEDFSDNEIESLSNFEIEKLRLKKLDKVVTKVFDDKNKNIEENLLDREDESFEVILPAPPKGDPRNAPVPPPVLPRPPPPLPTPAHQTEIPPSLSPDVNETVESTTSWTIFSQSNETATNPATNYTSWTSTSMTPDNATSPATFPASTTPQNNYTTTSDPITFPSDVNATTPVNATDATNDWNTTPLHETTSSSNFTTNNPTTPFDLESTTNIQNLTSTLTPPTTPFYNDSITSDHPMGPECLNYFEDFSELVDIPRTFDECLLGSTERNLKWVTSDGKLNVTIDGVKISDLSRSLGRYCNSSTNYQFEVSFFLKAEQV